jgi:hypothetical protein
MPFADTRDRRTPRPRATLPAPVRRNEEVERSRGRRARFAFVQYPLSSCVCDAPKRLQGRRARGRQKTSPRNAYYLFCAPVTRRPATITGITTEVLNAAEDRARNPGEKQA